MKSGDYRAQQVLSWSERQLQDAVIELAKQLGWRVYHTYDSRRSEPGFPDLVMLNSRQGRLLFRELKSEKGRLTADQRSWLIGLGCIVQPAEGGGSEVDADIWAGAAVWRPRDYLHGLIERELKNHA